MDEANKQIVPQQYEIFCDNYTEEREKWLGKSDLKDLFDAVKRSEQMN